MKAITFIGACAYLMVLTAQPISADSQLSPYPSGASKAPQPSTQQPKHEEKGPKFIPLPGKPALPVMPKPFGMPGVVGFQNGKWAGTDYLGFVANKITVDVEILKGENAPKLPEPSELEHRIAEIFSKSDITPKAELTEGPPLPFLHVLIIVYPVEKDKYAIIGSCRLFEQIQVMRKNFSPAGYWQGITWENQDIMLSSTEQLDTQIKAVVDKLVNAFVLRYRMYNPNDKE